MRAWFALVALVVGGGLAGCAAQRSTGPPVQTDTVTIPGQWVYEPAAIQVKAGTTVTWRDHGGADHTITFEDGSFDQVVHAGGSLTRTFPDPGTYAYGCKFHPPNMKGTVIVTA